jgi:hypothetical protein
VDEAKLGVVGVEAELSRRVAILDGFAQGPEVQFSGRAVFGHFFASLPPLWFVPANAA